VADDFRTDEEQAEALKNWFQEYGTSLVVGIVLALGGTFGYQSWQENIEETRQMASASYQELLEASEVSPFEEVSEEAVSTSRFLAENLKTGHADSSYAVFGALQMAKLYSHQSDWAQSKTELQWAYDHAEEGSLKIISAVRLAKVMVELDEKEAALGLLDSIKPGAHQTSVQETRGDILYDLGRQDEAREAYQMAVNSQIEGATKPSLQMKLDDLITPLNPVSMEDTAEENAETAMQDNTES